MLLNLIRPAVVGPPRPPARQIVVTAGDRPFPTPPPLREPGGYVYAAGNAYLDGFVKIGGTGRCPYERVAELETGQPGRLHVLLYVECWDWRAAETLLHRELADRRAVGSEWFTVPVGELIFAAARALDCPVRRLGEVTGYHA